jgi:very-short-patch-repair endonuclease
MTRRTPVEATQIGLPIASRDLGAAGIPASRVRAKDVSHPFRGVHLFGPAPADLVSRCESFLPLLRRDEAFSHTTAARLLGAPLPRAVERDARLHVTRLGGTDRVRRPGVTGHRAASLPRTFHLGLPIVAPAHAWFQLATMLTHDDLVAVGDYLVTPHRRRKTPAIAHIAALAAAIPARARGASRARRALSDVRVGPESRMETLLRLLLTRAGLPEPELNPPVDVGSRVLHPDLLFRQWRLVLEYEGDGHRTDPQQWRRDIWRREAFQAAGFRVMQVHSEDVLAEPEQFLARVAHAIAQRRML